MTATRKIMDLSSVETNNFDRLFADTAAFGNCTMVTV